MSVLVAIALQQRLADLFLRLRGQRPTFSLRNSCAHFCSILGSLLCCRDRRSLSGSPLLTLVRCRFLCSGFWGFGGSSRPLKKLVVPVWVASVVQHNQRSFTFGSLFSVWEFFQQLDQKILHTISPDSCMQCVPIMSVFGRSKMARPASFESSRRAANVNLPIEQVGDLVNPCTSLRHCSIIGRLAL